MKRLILILLTICGCEVADDPANLTDPGRLVVEAWLTNENIRHEVRLTRTFSELNEDPPVVSDAFVAINDGDRTIRLFERILDPGVYRPLNPFRAVFNKPYILYINIDGVEYISSSSAQFVAQMEPPVLVENEDGSYQYIYQESAEPSMTEVYLSWTAEVDGVQEQQEAQLNYYTLNVIDVNSIIPPEKETVTIPAGTTMIRKKFSLNADQQEFIRSYLSEVDWRGGYFDVAHGNVISNISGDALGFFGVSMVVTDTTVVN